MNFMDAVSTCFKKYTTFSGRARRSEYWYFSLFNMIVSFVLGLLPPNLAFLSAIFAFAVLLPGMAVCARRLHDIGKAGTWMLLALVPVVGTIIVLVWLCKDSDPGSNAYGVNPKTVGGGRI